MGSPAPAVCFSFAAYSKSMMKQLRSRGVPIGPGLSEAEFSGVESAHRFEFPPDLRSILREGLPLAPGFPDWRSGSPNQLRILLSLPVSSLIRQISRPGSLFWPPAWGPRPESQSQSIAMARSILSGAAQLVPVYRHFYIAASPNLAGNPLFRIRDGGDVRCCGFDLADFFRRERMCSSAPAWAAKEARRVAVWSDLARGGERAGVAAVEELMRQMGRRLREGGWGEEEVREMMMMMPRGGCGSGSGSGSRSGEARRDRVDGVMRHLRGLARVMLRAGWTNQDVAYAMGGGTGGMHARGLPALIFAGHHVDTALDFSSTFNYLPN